MEPINSSPPSCISNHTSFANPIISTKWLIDQCLENKNHKQYEKVLELKYYILKSNFVIQYYFTEYSINKIILWFK